MFDKYIQDTVQGILVSFDKLADGNFSFAKLIATENLAEQYKNFFEAELNWWIFAEVSDLVNSEHFDYTSTSFFSANLDDELRTAAFITPYKLNEFVEFAVTTRINFLCRPQFTLISFLFNGKDSISCDEALMRMNYFSDYHYYKKEIKNWLIAQQENEVDFISKEELSEKIDDIEYQNVLNLSSDEFVNLLEPMFDFFNTKIENSDDLLLPTEALMIFFDDKNIKPLVKILEKKYTTQDVKFISKESLYHFINEMIEVTENDEFEEELVIQETESEEEVEDLQTDTDLDLEEIEEIEEIEINEEKVEDFVPIAEDESIEEDSVEEIEESINNNSNIELEENDYEINLDEIEDLINSSQNSTNQNYSDDFDIQSELNSIKIEQTEDNINPTKVIPALVNLNAVQSINAELESFVSEDEEIGSQFSSLEEMIESNYEDSSTESLDDLLSEIKELEDISEGEIEIPETNDKTDLNTLDDFTKDIENLIN